MASNQCEHPRRTETVLDPLSDPPIVADPHTPEEIALACQAGTPAAAGVNWGAADFDCPTLADYRLFEDPTDTRNGANPGGTPFDLTTPLFSDYAQKDRFVFIPPGEAATLRRGRRLPVPGRNDHREDLQLRARPARAGSPRQRRRRDAPADPPRQRLDRSRLHPQRRGDRGVPRARRRRQGRRVDRERRQHPGDHLPDPQRDPVHPLPQRSERRRADRSEGAAAEPRLRLRRWPGREPAHLLERHRHPRRRTGGSGDRAATAGLERSERRHAGGAGARLPRDQLRALPHQQRGCGRALHGSLPRIESPDGTPDRRLQAARLGGSRRGWLLGTTSFPVSPTCP